jgi:hypothetical protein
VLNIVRKKSPQKKEKRVFEIPPKIQNPSRNLAISSKLDETLANCKTTYFLFGSETSVKAPYDDDMW